VSELRSITIVGGGLAGLTLGLGLRRAGVPVTVWEAGRYPRHRVCGEFISGRGQEVLASLGLAGTLSDAGSLPIGTAVFHWASSSSPVRALPQPAWSVSRYTLDALLADAFRRQGGTLREGERWSGSEAGESIVRADGRRAAPVEQGRRWFGLKCHAIGVKPRADLEFHVLREGYVGVSRLRGERFNVCGLFWRASGAETPAPGHELLRGPAGSRLRESLAEAEFDKASSCAVAGLSLRPHRAARRPECCIGDALTMIPPVTGNGMSMAFEAAALAVEPLEAYARGKLAWERARQEVAAACDTAFARRLRWARGLQWVLLSPAFRELGGWILRSPRLWRLLFNRTR
jgi:2-polyprenyl-6-methoxyphenol hydroxylase-like FAD-dependent oxidoreductase